MLFYHFPIHTLKPVPLSWHTTKIVINETCRLITLDVENLYVNTLINTVLHIAELLLTFSSTKTSVQKITLLLHRIRNQYCFQFSNNFQTYERYFHEIHYFLSRRRDISTTVVHTIVKHMIENKKTIIYNRYKNGITIIHNHTNITVEEIIIDKK